MLLKDMMVVFAVIFIAELGDKTQLGALTIAIKTRSIPKTVLYSMAGLILATMISVTVGYLLLQIIPGMYIIVASGIIFIILGFASLLSKEGTEVTKETGATLSIFLLELGDKTQLSIISFTVLLKDPLIVFLMATMAFLAVTLITATLGTKIAEKIPQEKIRCVSACLFIIIGVIILANIFIQS